MILKGDKGWRRGMNMLHTGICSTVTWDSLMYHMTGRKMVYTNARGTTKSSGFTPASFSSDQKAEFRIGGICAKTYRD